MRLHRLLSRWRQQVPRDGVDLDDVLGVMRHLKMDVQARSSGHLLATHRALIGSMEFPQGGVTINCHAFGKQGRVHPSAIRDLLKAATIIEQAAENERSGSDEAVPG